MNHNRNSSPLLTNGNFTTIDPPAASWARASGINDLGQIAGTYVDGSGSYANGSRSHGFLRTHGQFVTLNTSNAAIVPAPPNLAAGINRFGQIVGQQDEQAGNRNYRLGADGSVAALRDGLPFFIHFPTGINDRGEIAGESLEVDSVAGMFVAFGQEWRFGVLNIEYSWGSAGAGLNNRGQIVGSFWSDHGVSDGYVLTPVNVIEDVSASASPDGARIPLATVIVDDNLAIWTLGPGEEILRNGAQLAGGYGSQILWHRGSIYVLGDDYNWWQWTGSTWTYAGSSDPDS